MADKDSSLDRFRHVLGRLVRVPKQEVLEKEREYKRKRRGQRSRAGPRRKTV